MTDIELLEKDIDDVLKEFKNIKIKEQPSLHDVSVSEISLFGLERFRIDIESKMEKEKNMPMLYTLIAIFFSLIIGFLAFVVSNDLIKEFPCIILVLLFFWVFLSGYLINEIIRLKKYARMMELYSRTLGLLELLIKKRNEKNISL